MNSSFALLVCLGLAAGLSYAQVAATRHNFEFGAAGVFPVGGERLDGYSAGPGWRAGYEFRLLKHVGAEAGFTEGWPNVLGNCKFGCDYSREKMKLLDYGVRAVAPLAGGRVELSAGLGGGYVWHQYGYSGPFGTNLALLQYSGKAAIALDRRGRLRAGFTARTWRDIGRPTQVWLSLGGSLILGL